MVRAMARLAWLALVCTAACGQLDDNRSPDVDAQYITAAILAPTCGSAQCHSTFTQKHNEVFDTLEGMRAAMVNQGLVVLGSSQFDPAAPEASTLIAWLTKTDPFNLGIGRMPLDAPMPNQDIHLLEDWIRGPVQEVDVGATCGPTQACAAGDTCKIPSGQTTGECFHITYDKPAAGAQCNPASFGGMACIGRDLYRCGADWNVVEPATPCPGDCAAGACQ